MTKYANCDSVRKRQLTAGGLFLLAAFLILPAGVSLANVPEVTVTQTSGRIDIDGSLDDAGWRAVYPLEGFTERSPNENTPPAVATKALVTYDENNLYVAFVCNDDPSQIRSTVSQRDQFGSDDAVAVMIDTYGDAAWAYMLFVNPYGVQKDYLWSSVAGEDTGFDLIWNAAAKTTDKGYQVELAIPFTSMRFPNTAEQNWRIDFRRVRPRETWYEYAWSPHDRNEQCKPCQWGTLKGINNVHPGKGLEILPTYLAHQSGQINDFSNPSSGFSDSDIKGELSLGGKYAIASDIVAEAAYNPDFSQIESDAAQVDVNSTIALFYPERRPFFQEGADVFRTLFNSFYTRTVNDPEYAIKMISRREGYTFGFMSAQDENTAYVVPLEERTRIVLNGRSYMNVLRGSRSIGQGSQLGFILTDRRLDGGGYGSIAALDGEVKLSRNYAIDGQYLASFTGEPESAGASDFLQGTSFDEGTRTAVFDGEEFSGNALITRLKHFARSWSFLLDYNQVDPSYRTQSGFDPVVDYRNASLWTGYTFWPTSGLFQRIQPELWTDGRWRYDGLRRWEHQQVGVNGDIRWAQTWFSVHFTRGSEAWTSGVNGEVVKYDDLFSAQFDWGSDLSDAVDYSASIDIGRVVGRSAEAIGNETALDLSLGIKPIDRLVIEPNINFVRSDHTDIDQELYRQFIARTRFRFQLNRELSVRLVVQYDNSRAVLYLGDSPAGPEYMSFSDKVWDVDPLVTYRLSPFSVIYAGSTHDYSYFPADENRVSSRWKLSSRQFFVKLQYLFRV